MTILATASLMKFRPPRQFVIGATVVSAWLLVLLAGCTVTEKNYRTLSRFFDGVPDPNAPTNKVAMTVSGSPGQTNAGGSGPVAPAS